LEIVKFERERLALKEE